jgi:hypothetical protein
VTYVAPIVITKKEELSNRGERAIVSIAEARLKSVMGMLQREFEKQIIANSTVSDGAEHPQWCSWRQRFRVLEPMRLP